MVKRYVAVDPAFSNTGIAILEEDNMSSFGFKPSSDNLDKWKAQLEKIKQIVDIVDNEKPNVLIIEDLTGFSTVQEKFSYALEFYFFCNDIETFMYTPISWQQVFKFYDLRHKNTKENSKALCRMFGIPYGSEDEADAISMIFFHKLVEAGKLKDSKLSSLEKRQDIALRRAYKKRKSNLYTLYSNKEKCFLDANFENVKFKKDLHFVDIDNIDLELKKAKEKLNCDKIVRVKKNKVNDKWT